MAVVRWNPSKNEELKKKRGVSFEEILSARLVSVQEHPSRTHQNIMLFELDGYIWVVPYVQQGEKIFLKTLFPSRKYTRKWKEGELT